jgi:thiol:disulfide interchange protein DsbC
LNVLRPALFIGLSALCLLVFLSGDAHAFGEIAGACEPECAKCHRITKEQASGLIKALNPEIEVLDVGAGPVRGLWEVALKARGGKRGVAYIDFSLQHVIVGRVFKVSTEEARPEDLTKGRIEELNKVNLSTIPLDDALLLGSSEARYKAVVFDDPD